MNILGSKSTKMLVAAALLAGLSTSSFAKEKVYKWGELKIKKKSINNFNKWVDSKTNKNESKKTQLTKKPTDINKKVQKSTKNPTPHMTP